MNPVKHLWWRFFEEIVNSFWELTILQKISTVDGYRVLNTPLPVPRTFHKKIDISFFYIFISLCRSSFSYEVRYAMQLGNLWQYFYHKHYFSGFREIGGLNALWEKYPSAVPNATAVITSTSNNSSVSTVVFSVMATRNAFVSGNVTTTIASKFNADCYKVDPLWGHMFRCVKPMLHDPCLPKHSA